MSSSFAFPAPELEVVAEFVENEDIAVELGRLGVDYAQGYHFGKPVPLEDIFSHL